MSDIRTRDHRKKIPLSVLLEAYRVALAKALGLPSDTRFEADHDPALCLREFDPETGDFTPHQNDPAFIRIRTEEDHYVKTFGTKATTAGSDIHARAHGRRIRADEAVHAQAMLAKVGLAEPPERKPSRLQSRGFERGPKQKIPSRPFPKRPKKSRRTYGLENPHD